MYSLLSSIFTTFAPLARGPRTGLGAYAFLHQLVALDRLCLSLKVVQLRDESWVLERGTLARVEALLRLASVRSFHSEDDETS